MHTRHIVLFASLSLAGCVSAPPPPPPKTVITPPPAPAPAPAKRLSGDWNDWPFTPGDWNYSRDGRGSVGHFGLPGQSPKVSLRCDAQNRRVLISREASASAQRVVIRTSAASKTLTSKPSGTSSGNLTAELMPNDPILDAMAFSRGRILLEVEGQQPMIVPAWAEITRVVEDCRG